VNEQVPPAAGRVLGTGTCVALIAIGAILRLHSRRAPPHGLKVHVVGVIVIGGRRALPAAIAARMGPAEPGQAAPGRRSGYDPVAAERRVYQDERPQ
jgi:hypothetical protein